MNVSSIKISENGQRFLVSGELSFLTVPLLRQEGDHLITHADFESIVIDFIDVTECDSAALSLLTAWIRSAKKAQKSIQFAHLPSQLIEIAKLSHLDSLLPVASGI